MKTLYFEIKKIHSSKYDGWIDCNEKWIKETNCMYGQLTNYNNGAASQIIIVFNACIMIEILHLCNDFHFCVKLTVH